jgi:hypothetical protein
MQEYYTDEAANCKDVFFKSSKKYFGVFEILRNIFRSIRNQFGNKSLVQKLQMLRQVQKACGILPQNRPSLFFQQGKTEEAG